MQVTQQPGWDRRDDSDPADSGDQPRLLPSPVNPCGSQWGERQCREPVLHQEATVSTFHEWNTGKNQWCEEVPAGENVDTEILIIWQMIFIFFTFLVLYCTGHSSLEYVFQNKKMVLIYSAVIWFVCNCMSLRQIFCHKWTHLTFSHKSAILQVHDSDPKLLHPLERIESFINKKKYEGKRRKVNEDEKPLSHSQEYWPRITFRKVNVAQLLCKGPVVIV